MGFREKMTDDTTAIDRAVHPHYWLGRKNRCFFGGEGRKYLTFVSASMGEQGKMRRKMPGNCVFCHSGILA